MAYHTWPFDSAVIGSVTISPHDIVPGTPEFSVSGADGSTTLTDGTILFFRTAVLKTALFYVFGDKRSLATGAARYVTVSLTSGNTQFTSFSARVRTEYEEENDRTLLTLESAETLA